MGRKRASRRQPGIAAEVDLAMDFPDTGRMSSPSPTKARLQSLDLLRVLAAYWVVLYHCPFLAHGSWLRSVAGRGALGVDLFFALSGFLIGDQWLMLLRETEGRVSFGWFYIRRCLRIWPSYFFMIALLMAAPGFFHEPLVPLWKYLAFVQNFDVLTGFGASWSLCIEEHFYLLFPLIAFALFGRGARATVAAVLGILLFGIVIRSLLWTQLRPDLISATSPEAAGRLYLAKFYYPTWCRLDGLALGVSLAALKQFKPREWARLSDLGNGLLAAALGSAFFAVGIGSNTLQRFLPAALSAPGSLATYTLPAAAFGALGWALTFTFVIAAALSPRSVLGKVRIPGITALGTLSYAIYLTHEHVFRLAVAVYRLLGFTDAEPVGYLPTLGALILAIPLGAALYFGVERPFLQLRDRYFPMRKARTMASFLSFPRPEQALPK